MKKLYYLVIMGMIAAVVPACKKDSKPVTPVNKAIGKWNADYGVDQEYDDGKLTHSDTIKVPENYYIYTLNTDGTGNVYLSGKKGYTFDYTITDSKINYTNFVLYNPDGSVAGHQDPYYETIVSVSDTKLETKLEQPAPPQNGHTSSQVTLIYFTRVN